jgi:hypothetical protein
MSLNEHSGQRGRSHDSLDTELDGGTFARRKAKADNLLSMFAKAFPEICYNLLWDSHSVNAQAWCSGETRHVILYGGLVRHPLVSRSCLALTLAHETGHHLGGPPLDPELRWPTWQGQADYWAARNAMPRVFGTKARAITFRGARELVRLTRMIETEDSDLSVEERLLIFAAGATNQAPPTCLRKAFDRVLRRGRRFNT